MGKAAKMRVASATMRVTVATAVASLVAGCVQPVYQVPGPIQLQPYPPPVSYQYTPDYRSPDYGRSVSGPIPLQATPDIQPLPPPTPAPDTADLPGSDLGGSDLGGAIPVQDMPAIVEIPPATETAAPTPAAPAPEIVSKAPATSAGKNVPLEGFRPMHGQTRPAP